MKTQLENMARVALSGLTEALRDPKKLAEIFADMSSHEQAAFLAEVGRIARTWWSGSAFSDQAFFIGREMAGIKAHDAGEFIGLVFRAMSEET